MSDFDNQRHAPLRASRDDEEPTRSSLDRPPGSSRKTRSMSGNIFTLLLAIVVLLALGVTWKQSGEINQLREQFDELNGLIQSTDESLSQSGTALSLKIREQGQTLEEHWSEIKKLWGVSYDRNRKAIEENKQAVEKAADTAGKAQSAVSKQQQQLAQAQETFKKLETEMQTVSAAVKNLSNSALATSLQIEELETEMAATAEVQQKLAALTKRLSDAEATLEALDVYRSQINQQLHQLRQKVDRQP